MTRAIVFPRLLPMTIAALACALVVRSVDLVRNIVPARAEEPARATQAGAGKGPTETKPVKEGRPGAAEAAVPVQSPPAEPKPVDPPVSDAERTILLELRQRRLELQARGSAVASREAVLSAAERKIATRVDELQALQTKLEALETTRKAHDEANWRSMVKLYESMKPRDAAGIFNDLDMSVLLEVVDRMKEAKAAAIMAAMLPDKARQVTTELAQKRNKANADPGPSGG